MANKVILHLDDLFLSVGIDVSADFSWISIALPNQQFVGKPYKILHNKMNSLTTAVSKIKEAEELYSLGSRIFFESKRSLCTFRILIFVLFLVMIGLITEQLKPLSRR